MKKFLGVLTPVALIGSVFFLYACGGGGGGGETSTAPGQSTRTVSIAWDQVTQNADGSTCTDLGGYRIYYREAPGVTKTNSILVDVGNTLSAQIGNLTIGKTYYFRMASYDINGNESDLSAEELAVN